MPKYKVRVYEKWMRERIIEAPSTNHVLAMYKDGEIFGEDDDPEEVFECVDVLNTAEIVQVEEDWPPNVIPFNMGEKHE